MAVDVYTALGFIFLGMVLSIVGQGIRVIIGIKKQIDMKESKNWEEWFELRRFWTSLFIAIVVGGVNGSIISIWLPDGSMTVGLLIALIALGYSVTDFVEGFMGTTKRRFLIRQ